MRIAFVGCGAAGRSLGVAWRRAGHEIGAVRNRESSLSAVADLGAGVPDGPLEDADVVVFGTPDDVLAEVASRTSLREDQAALHLSGFHPSSILAPTGARAASLHPLRAFADIEASIAALPGTFFFIEGEASDVAVRLAEDAGGAAVRLHPDAKALYHAGAAIASNYVVTLIGVAQELFASAGVESEVALAALGSLVEGAMSNVAEVGLPQALTGPVSRGDVDVVLRHLTALPPRIQGLYRELLRAAIPIALQKGGLDDDGADALRDL